MAYVEEPKTPRIDSATGAGTYTIGIDAHGLIPSGNIEFIEVPENFVIIELGLPSQYTYAKYYEYMYAIFIKPILLNYLYDNKSLYEITAILKEGGDIDDIYTEEGGNSIQRYLLDGNFEELRGMLARILRGPIRDFETKLEILEMVIKNLTIYIPGDFIISRFISAYEDLDTKPIKIDETCQVDLLHHEQFIILNKMIHGQPLIVDGDASLKQLLVHPDDPLKSLKDIFTYDTANNGSVKDGTTTRNIIGDLTKLGNVKLIIFTCGGIEYGDEANKEEIHHLITHVMDIRNEFHQERSDNSGPNKAAKAHSAKEEPAYNSGTWCISGKTLNYIEEGILPANNRNDKNSNIPITRNDTRNGDEENQNNPEFCSTKEYVYTSYFIYVDLPDSINQISTDETITLPNEITSNPFLKLTFSDVIKSEFPLYNVLHIISKEHMTIYKMSNIFSKYITSDEVNKNGKDKVHVFLLDIYATFAAEYILKPFQIPEQDKTNQRVLSFNDFSRLTVNYVKELMQVTKLNIELESIVLHRSERIYNVKYTRIYKDYYTKYLTRFNPILTLDSSAEDIYNFIDLYCRYLYNALNALIYISTISNPNIKIRKEQLSSWEQKNIDLAISGNRMKDFFIESYKYIRNKLIEEYIKPIPVNAPLSKGKRPRATRKKNRKARKTRRKNHK